MKVRMLYTLILGVVLLGAASLQAIDDDACMSVTDCYLSLGRPYLTVGGGAVFPSRTSSSSGTSTAVLYSPTIPGTSVFILPRVVWDNKFKPGFELNAAIGIPFYNRWRFEEEFVYQNMQRDISGIYDWREVDASTRQDFAEQAGNPIRHATSTANLYALLSNVYYDFCPFGCLKVDVGGGVGIAWLQSTGTRKNHFLHIQTVQPPLDITSPTVEKSPSLRDTAFAWQVKAGLSYAFTYCCTIGIHYRLLGTTRFRAGASSVTTNPGTPGEAKFTVPSTDVGWILNNSVNLAFDYSF